MHARSRLPAGGGGILSAPPEGGSVAARLVTAAVAIVGNEILSGRTQDANLAWLARRLDALGIRLVEARVVRDEQAAIVAAVRALAEAYDYVFTTGGIGPTHDDITPGAIAAAFGRPLVRHAEAVALLMSYYEGRGIALNEARLRMAEAAEGAELIHRPGSGIAFRVENVFALAGIPRIMQAQFAVAAPLLRRGPVLLSRTIECRLTEGEFAAGLAAVQREFPQVEIGSYPDVRADSPAARIVLRAVEAAPLAEAVARVIGLLEAAGGAPAEAAPEASPGFDP